MAHKKAGGSSRNGRDSKGKRLGIKAFGGEHVIPGNIIARQRGTAAHLSARDIESEVLEPVLARTVDEACGLPEFR